MALSERKHQFIIGKTRNSCQKSATHTNMTTDPLLLENPSDLLRT
jgi:hypothetical protein